MPIRSVNQSKHPDRASDYMKLKALLWKCSIIRKKRYGRTLSLFAGCLVYLLLFIFRKTINDQDYGDLKQFDTKPQSFLNLADTNEIRGIIYSTIEPGNKLTDGSSDFIKMLMRKVGKRLNLHNIVHYADPNYMITRNTEKLWNDRGYMAVIFNNSNGDIVNDFIYTIRCNYPYDINTMRPKAFLVLPNMEFGENSLSFATLQMAIDSTFIEMKSGFKIAKKLAVQAFPYPPYNYWVSVKYESVLPSIIIIGGTSLVFVIAFELIDEKNSNIKELMRKMGIRSSVIWFSHYLHYIATQFIVTIIILLFLKLGDCPVIPKMNWFVLWLTLFIYVNYLIFYGFILSIFFSHKILATSVIAFNCIAWYKFEHLKLIASSNKLQSYVYSLFPHITVKWLCTLIGIYEELGIGITFDNITMDPLLFPLSYGTVLMFICLNTLLCIPIIVVADLIDSNFSPFTYIREKLHKKKIVDESIPLNVNLDYFEDRPPNSEIGIKIMNVSKDFYNWDGYKQAVLDNVRFNVYKGCITVLFGNSGAGKSTLLSIITGLISPTSGKIKIQGKHIDIERYDAVNNVGVCPQKNITFPELTVEENVEFFAISKGLNGKWSKADTRRILEQLNLTDKQHEMGFSLSPKAQRRLQLAMALAGRSRVLILDEPTLELDPNDRREIWETLLELRRHYTILLTTNSSDEAEALGDHIGILHAGLLKCYGTSGFLKNLTCPGYKLTMIKSKDFGSNPELKATLDEIDELSDMMTKISENEDNVEYLIDVDCSHRIRTFFHQHEDRLKECGIVSMRISTRTIDDVFFKMCDVDRDFTDDQTYIEPTKTYERSFIAKFTALLYKKFLFHKYNFYLWLPQVLLFIFIMFIIFSCNHDGSKPRKRLSMDIGAYSCRQRVLYSMSDNFKRDVLRYLMKSRFGPKIRKIEIDFHKTLYHKHATYKLINESVYNGILQVGAENLKAYSSINLIALSFKMNEYLMYYSISLLHTLPVGVNLLTNSLISFLNGEEYITTYNEPIVKQSPFDKIGNPETKIYYFVLYSTIGWHIFTSIFLSYALDERISGFRDLLLINGISKLTYWFSNYLYDALICIVTITIVIIIGFITNPLNIMTTSFIVPLSVSIYLNMTGSLLFIYFMSFIWKTKKSAVVQYIILILIFNILGIVKLANLYFTESDEFSIFIDVISFIPMININLITYYVFTVSSMQKFCLLHENRTETSIWSFETPCQYKDMGINITYYGISDFYTDPTFNIRYLTAMSILGIVLFTGLIIVCELKVIDRIMSAICTELYKPDISSSLNNAIGFEDYTELSFKTDNISKVYYDVDFNSKHHIGLKSVNLQLKKGECYGLIGINGSGKSAILKILTGLENPTYGCVTIFGNTIENNASKYSKMISFCPQFNAIGEYLTAEEALTLFTMIQGVPARFTTDLVEKYIREFGLTELKDVRCKYYNAGNKRMLNLAVAIISLKPYGPYGEILLLDEPTAGTDPYTRKLLQRTITEINHLGISVIVASQNMSECDQICSRLGIMFNGRLMYEDTAEKIKYKLNIGYIVMFKFRMYSISDETPTESVEQLKSQMMKKFKCRILDEHKYQIHFQIGKKLISYRRLFAELENIRSHFSRLIEHYNISETTLEDIFMECIERHKKSQLNGSHHFV